MIYKLFGVMFVKHKRYENDLIQVYNGLIERYGIKKSPHPYYFLHKRNQQKKNNASDYVKYNNRTRARSKTKKKERRDQKGIFPYHII